MDNQVIVGRYLCKLYYSGTLRPSVFYSKEDARYKISRCVEKVIEDAEPHTSYIWAALLAGNLRELNQMARARVLGGGASNPDFDWDLRQDWAKLFGVESAPVREDSKIIGDCMASVDGVEGVRVSELVLYYNVGEEFIRSCM